MSDTIILDSDFEDSNDGIMVVEQISVKRSRSGMGKHPLRFNSFH